MRIPSLFSRPTVLSFVCVGVLIASASGAVLLRKSAGVTMVESAQAFLSTLDKSGKSTALLTYDSEKRTGWHFIPKESRKGLVLREMNTAQKAAALRLLRAALSQAGFEKSRRIMLLEAVLLEMEGPKSKGKRDPEKYYVTLFGEPNDTSTWGFSFEGHHLSLNFVVEGGKVVDSTPQFFAANPATVMNETTAAIKKGTRVLRDEEQLAFDLVGMLDKGQQETAIFADEAPAEISGAGEAQPTNNEQVGISFNAMNGPQQDLLRDLIDTYIGAMPEEVARDRRQILEDDGYGEIHFGWAGATRPGIGHYYRIGGKRFVIEFVNTQPDPAGNPANHIHCIWRDLTGDFNLPAN